MELILAIYLLVFIVVSIFWLYSLVHCIKNTRLDDTNRIIGVILIVVLGPIGSILYFVLLN